MKYRLDEKTFDVEQQNSMLDELKRQLDELISVRDVRVSVLTTNKKQTKQSQSSVKNLAFQIDKEFDQILKEPFKLE